MALRSKKTKITKNCMNRLRRSLKKLNNDYFSIYIFTAKTTLSRNTKIHTTVVMLEAEWFHMQLRCTVSVGQWFDDFSCILQTYTKNTSAVFQVQCCSSKLANGEANTWNFLLLALIYPTDMVIEMFSDGIRIQQFDVDRNCLAWTTRCSYGGLRHFVQPQVHSECPDRVFR